MCNCTVFSGIGTGEKTVTGGTSTAGNANGSGSSSVVPIVVPVVLGAAVVMIVVGVLMVMKNRRRPTRLPMSPKLPVVQHDASVWDTNVQVRMRVWVRQCASAWSACFWNRCCASLDIYVGCGHCVENALSC